MQWPTRLSRSPRYSQMHKSKIFKNVGSWKWEPDKDKVEVVVVGAGEAIDVTEAVTME